MNQNHRQGLELDFPARSLLIVMNSAKQDADYLTLCIFIKVIDSIYSFSSILIILLHLCTTFNREFLRRLLRLSFILCQCQRKHDFSNVSRS